MAKHSKNTPSESDIEADGKLQSNDKLLDQPMRVRASLQMGSKVDQIGKKTEV